MTTFDSRKEMIDRQRRALLLTAGAAAGAAALPYGWLTKSAQAAGGTVVWGTNEAYSRPAMMDPFTEKQGSRWIWRCSPIRRKS